MRANAMNVPIIGGALALLASAPALPQQMQPYHIETFGVFRNLMMTGDFSTTVRLDDAMARHPTTGVGALADARGEITIFDGKLIVTFGKTGTSSDANSESAALLAMGSVAEWQSVRVEQDVSPDEIESYIVIAAKAHGLDPEESFPFEVRGIVGPYSMHVNAAPTIGEHGMGLPMAITVQNQGDRIDGMVAGLYVSLDLMGVATHGGQRTHAHWVSVDSASTAHLDQWGLRAGAFLLLPKRE
jgi:alpha-acetolactate decarboxylase